MTAEQRLKLDTVEPFDEWEEFVNFASHYFLLVAVRPSRDRELTSQNFQSIKEKSVFSAHDHVKSPLIAHSQLSSTSYKSRRFGAAFSVSPEIIGHHGGSGPQRRQNSTDFYKCGQSPPSHCQTNSSIEMIRIPPAGIEPRTCHTITTFKDESCLLVGGRAAPDQAFRSCWLLHKCWERVEDLPVPLFRHCATQLASKISDGTIRQALIYGGKSGGAQISNRWLLWRESLGWKELCTYNVDFRARFGATMTATGTDTGVIMGGMAEDSSILCDLWQWTLSETGDGVSVILRKLNWSCDEAPDITGRFGACLANSPVGILLIGGVASRILPQNFDYVCLTRDLINENSSREWRWAPINNQTSGRRPLLIGHCTFVSEHFVIILGGGAVCFSFGSYLNADAIVLSKERDFIVQMLNNKGDLGSTPPSTESLASEAPNGKNSLQHQELGIKHIQIQTSKEFEQILDTGLPVIMGNTDLGVCTAQWTLDRLKTRVGGHRKVIEYFQRRRSLLILAGRGT